MMKTKKSDFYVKPSVLKDQLRDYYKTDVVSDELAISIYKIAHGLSYKPCFINYSFKADMLGDAVLKMMAALMKKTCDVDANPFSYFTTIAYHSFINRIKVEKKNQTMIEEYREHQYPELIHEQDHSHAIYVRETHDDYDEI